MKFVVSTFLCIAPVYLHAFVNNQFPSRISTAKFSLPTDVVSSAKEELLSFAKQQFAESKTGVFIGDDKSKIKFKKLTAELEAVCENPTESSQSLMVGDWKLLCTIATPSEDISTRLPKKKKMKRGPFSFLLSSAPEFLQSALDPIQGKVKESVEVIQRIRKIDDDDSEAGGEILNRVDNVIAFSPFSLENLSLNFNPLEVSKSKVSLIHSARVQSVSPVLRTKLVLKSVVLTVAGTSQYLEPEGADVLGLNVPLGDLFNFGSFDTTYVDEDIRISRGKVGLVEQLRVFERAVDDMKDDSIVEEADIVEETEYVSATSDDETVEILDEKEEEEKEEDATGNKEEEEEEEGESADDEIEESNDEEIEEE